MLQLFEQLGLALDAKAGEAVQLACCRRLLEIDYRVHFELVVDGPCSLRPDARHIGEFDEPSRQTRLRLVQDREMLGGDKLRDFARQIGADARELCKILPISNEVGGAARKILDRARGSAVGANAERIGTFDLEQIGEVIESGRNFGIVDRHRARSRLYGTSCPTGPANRPRCLDQDQVPRQCGAPGPAFTHRVAGAPALK